MSVTEKLKSLSLARNENTNDKNGCKQRWPHIPRRLQAHDQEDGRIYTVK